MVFDYRTRQSCRQGPLYMGCTPMAGTQAAALTGS